MSGHQRKRERSEKKNEGGNLKSIKKKLSAFYEKYVYDGAQLSAEEEINNQGAYGEQGVVAISDTQIGQRAESSSVVTGEILRYLLTLLFGFLLARSPMAFNTYPLGIALLCASTMRVSAVAIGMVTGALSLGSVGYIYAGGAVAAYILRQVTSRWLFPDASALGNMPKANRSILSGMTGEEETAQNESPTKRRRLVFDNLRESIQLRMATACVIGFMVSIYNIISNGYRYHDLYGAFFLMVVCPILVFIYSGYYDIAVKNTPFYEAAVAGLLFSMVYGLRDIYIYGISLAILAAFVISLAVSKLGGPLRGGVIGLLCGIAVDPIYAPLFGIAGFLSGLLWSVSSFVATSVACISGLIWGTYTEGFTGLARLMPEVIGGACLMWPLVQYKLLPKITIFSEGEVTINADSEAKIGELRQESMALKIAALSDTFKSLSGVFYTLSDRMRRPGIIDLRQLCDAACDKYCVKCGMRGVCWEREYGTTLDLINKLTAELHQYGRVTKNAVPEHMAKRCCHIDQIIDEINLSCAALIEQAIRNDKTEVFAIDYDAVSRILSDSLEADREEYEEDAALGGRLKLAIRSMDFFAENIRVYGKRKRYIYADGVSLRDTGAGAQEIREVFEKVCGCRLTNPGFELENQLVTMSMISVRRYSAKYAKATSVMCDGEINGDSINMFENREDYFYAMISDGMGSGREAALTSRICQLFMEKMLASGNKKTVTLDMINNFVRSKGIECSATIDLFELDMITGEASFIKSGAAPSYIRRDGNLFRIQSKTVPIGIMRALDAEQIWFDVKDGDIVIMLSDGIAQSYEESEWLLDLLTNEWNNDLERMAATIVERAQMHNDRGDDMTVGLICIKEERQLK
ncbi:MAG: SpoIIE family protein phosphatase [Clostridiales bacterium]|nr:SpoIIE family protein phosphatase [Clostridiales bacterium]